MKWEEKGARGRVDLPVLVRLRRTFPHELAALARALIMQPQVLLADEPTGNLDRQTADQVADLMLEVQRDENTILMLATHSRTLAEKMQRTAELVDGRLQSK